MKFSKKYRIMTTILGIITIILGILILIVSPVVGILAVGFAVLIIIHVNTKKKEPTQDHRDQNNRFESSLTNYSQKPININTVSPNGENHRVAGVSYRQKAIESLGDPNDEYSYTKRELIDFGMEDERIYEMTFSPHDVELVEEPDNPHDPNAIRVTIDGVHVGYIKRGSTAHVKKLIHSGTIKRITAEIGGGKYKVLESEYDDDKEKNTYMLSKDEINYFVSIRIITE